MENIREALDYITSPFIWSVVLHKKSRMMGMV